MVIFKVEEVKRRLQTDSVAGLSAQLIGRKGSGFGGTILYEGSQKESCVFVSLSGRGRGIKPHRHKGREEIYVILDGWGEMLVGDETCEVVKGDVVFVPVDTAHGLRNLGDIPLDALVFTAPPFDDTDRTPEQEESLPSQWR